MTGDAQRPEFTIATGLVAHTSSKCVNAGVTGGWHCALTLAPGMAVYSGEAAGWLVA